MLRTQSQYLRSPRREWLIGLGTFALLAVTGCPANGPMQVPPGQPAVIAPEPPRETAALPETGRSAGAPCFSAGQCESNTCEGGSCDGNEAGSCAPVDRACSEVAGLFCGCDGNTFSASESCPGEPFAYKGACTANAADAGVP